ncbi:MAG: hypothetical protein KJZ74_09200 [Gemmatimonadales bacterium]|nr:hypothetical protein [Gemmatimonadales bacterium]
MRHLVRCLALLLALASYETTALAASAPCTAEANAAMAEMGMPDVETPDCGSHDEHESGRGHSVHGCALTLACATVALPVIVTTRSVVAAASHLAADTERSLIPGARPAPDVPPPRA